MMKIKRKVPVFSMIVQRVTESRFPEIQSVSTHSDGIFQFILHPDEAAVTYSAFLWRFMHRLADEFAEPSKIYRFELLQEGSLVSVMHYDENLNRVLSVN